jgi:predicted transcriptional regulator
MRSKKILQGYYNEKGFWQPKKHKKWRLTISNDGFERFIIRKTFDNKNEEMIIRFGNQYIKITSSCDSSNKTYLIRENITKTISWQAKELLIKPNEITERLKKEIEKSRIKRLNDPMRHLNYPYEFDENGNYCKKENYNENL